MRNSAAVLPAYTNKETGYRYYTVEQLLIVELIHICIELGIPLKNFKNYITPQEDIDIEKLVAEGSEIVNEKIRKLESQKQFLSNVFVHVQRTNMVQGRQEPFVEAFPDRYFLTIDYDGDLADYKTINMEYSKLFAQSLRLGIAISSIRAFFLFGKTSVKKIFLEIPKPAMDIENLYVLAGSRFSCRIPPFNEICIRACRKRFLHGAGTV